MWIHSQYRNRFVQDREPFVFRPMPGHVQNRIVISKEKEEA